MAESTSLVTFGAIVLIGIAVTYAFSPGPELVTKRLGHLWRLPGRERKGLKEIWQALTETALAGLAKVLPSPGRAAELDARLVQAGFRRPEAASALRFAKLVTIAALEALIFFSGFYQNNPILIILVAAVAGWILPDMWVSRRITRRQTTLRLALPDALDLLVICMEAGLGIDQALLYVSQELRIAHPELCDEFDLVNAEMRVGKTRIEALRSLAARTGVDDLQGLVATLIQTDRFGTSVAQSLRVHADDLRTRRRQRAEEMAAKTSVKMVIPLVIFIFPALFVVVLGPALITIMRTMGNLH